MKAERERERERARKGRIYVRLSSSSCANKNNNKGFFIKMCLVLFSLAMEHSEQHLLESVRISVNIVCLQVCLLESVMHEMK